MSLGRSLKIPCPACGYVGYYYLEPTEQAPLVELVHCGSKEGGCDVPFAVEVRLDVQVTVSTCRLTLPSTGAG